MGRISERNLCYRSREQIAEDLHIALHCGISYGGRHSLYKRAFWAWSEFEGKHEGCHWWSRAALESWAEHRDLKRLCHEHVVPMDTLIGIIEKLNDKSAHNIRNVLHKFCVGVSILRTEHALLNTRFRSTMPDGWGQQPLGKRDEFARYRVFPQIVLVCQAPATSDSFRRNCI